MDELPKMRALLEAHTSFCVCVHVSGGRLLVAISLLHRADVCDARQLSKHWIIK